MLVNSRDIINSPHLIIRAKLEIDSKTDGQCDCACATTAVSLLYQHETLDGLLSDLKTPLLALSVDSDHSCLITNKFNFIVANNLAMRMINSTDGKIPVDNFFTFHKKNWKKAAIWGGDSNYTSGDGLLDTNEILSYEEDRALSVWLHTTNRCNLNCSYCYLSKDDSSMPLRTGYDAIRMAFRTANLHNYRRIKFKYAGGEPLLCFENVLKMHSYAQVLAKEYDVLVEGIILSNGTLLTPIIANHIRDHEMQLMISLDGIGHFHDVQRADSSRNSCFNIVSKNIDMLTSYGITPHISVTISGLNIDGLPMLMNWLLERNLPFKLNFYRENEQSVSRSELQLEESKFINGMTAAYEVLESNLPKFSLVDSLLDHVSFSHLHLKSCGVGCNYMVIDTHGRVSRCPMTINEPVASIYDIAPFAAIQKGLQGIQNLSVNEKFECKECKWRWWCSGGCPLMTYRATGRYDRGSPNCNIYKALLPKVVRLEGLRLLKLAFDNC